METVVATCSALASRDPGETRRVEYAIIERYGCWTLYYLRSAGRDVGLGSDAKQAMRLVSLMFKDKAWDFRWHKGE